METQHQAEVGWRAWPVSWSAVWVGALAALTLGLVIGLIGYAVGAHEIVSPRITKWSTVRMTTVLFSICGAFFAYVLGGWVAARVAGIRRAEPAMLHGVVAFLVTVPIMLVLGDWGAAGHFGGWYGGLGGTPIYAANAAMSAATDATAAQAARNTALTTVVSLLLGIVGSVLGGWMASGEPMSLTYYRRRDLDRYERPRRAA